ncbi:MAG: AMP-binding protein [Deltaproteobacteria bacterium]|nr:AMP-binding protein [Deltaproteobacteria bacterium]
MPLSLDLPPGSAVAEVLEECEARIAALSRARLSEAFPGWGRVFKILGKRGPAQSYFSSALVFDQRGAPPGPAGFRTRGWEGALWPGCPLSIHLETEDTAGRGGGLSGRVRVDRSLLGAEIAWSVRAGFLSVLSQVTGDPSRAVRSLTLLASGEGERIRSLALGPQLPAPTRESLGFQLRRRLEEAGRAPALSSPNGRLDGGGLLARAREISDFSGGMGPGLLGALLLPMGADFAAGALSLLMSGAAAAPLDPEWARPRLRNALADADPDLLVLSEALNPLAEEHGAPRLVFREGGGLSPLPGLRPSRAPLPPQTACVLYSGASGGTALGAVFEGRAVAARARQIREAWKLGPRDKCAFLLGATAPEALPVLCAAVLAGAEFCLPPAWARASGASFLDYVRREGVTVAFVPALLARGLQSGEAPPSLRAVVASGGRVSFYRPQPYSFWSVWGARETLGAGLRRQLGEQLAVHPLGRPEPGAEAWVLSRAGAPRPVGLPGEICLGGPLVAREYLNRPEESAGRLGPGPAGAAGAGDPSPLYRTGRRGVLRADGDLFLKGRQGEIPNVLGLEPEIQDIEKAVKVYPGVFDVRVVSFSDPKGLLTAAAYVIRRGASPPPAPPVRRAAPSPFAPGDGIWLEPEPMPQEGPGGVPAARPEARRDQGKDGGPGSLGGAVAPPPPPARATVPPGAAGPAGPAADDDALFVRKLEAHLRAVLPPALAPRCIVCVPSFPLTEAGSLDLAALPKPWREGFRAGSDTVPGTLGEYLILKEVRRAWPREEAGLSERFTDLGGDSLSAAEFSWSLRERLGLAPCAREVLASASFRDLARTLEGMLAEKGGGVLTLRRGRGPALVIVPAAAGGVLPWRGLLEALPEAVPVLALDPYGDFHRTHRGAREDELTGLWAEQAAASVAAALPRQGFVVLGSGFKASLAWECARRLRESRGLAARALVLLDAAAPPAGGGAFPVPSPQALGRSLETLYHYEGAPPTRREASEEALLFELRSWWATPPAPLGVPVLSVRSAGGPPEGHLPVPHVPAPLESWARAGFREMTLEGDSPSLHTGSGAAIVAKALEALLS